MNEYMLAVLLEQKNQGESFGRWPLHVTLVPWFELKQPLADVVAGLTDVLRSCQSFSVKIGHKHTLHGKAVTLVEPSAALHALHMNLVDFVDECGLLDKSTNFIGKDYVPHITEKINATVQPGFNVAVKKIYLIEAPKTNPHTRLKRVAAIGVLS